ncbi:MAG TPA: 2-oxo-tetronate isomerase [Casimicrobiaceae bacterium]|nr:2-oxo-tetronate isomerase [Casimicrobiaceae bacterium]
MPRFSAHLTQLFTELPFAERFAAAARAGFKGCEFRSPYEHGTSDVARWLSDSGLECVLFNLPAGDWARGERGIAALPGRAVEFRDSVHVALDYARALGTRQLHVMAGVVVAGAPVEACRETFVANLRFGAELASREGVVLLIEALNTRDTPGYFLTTQAQADAIRSDVGAANVKLQLDFYHAQRMEGDLAAKLNEYLPVIGHVQVAGVPGRHEPDDGEVNYSYLLRLLDELGYGGWVGCEYVPRDGTVKGLRWMQSIDRKER